MSVKHGIAASTGGVLCSTSQLLIFSHELVKCSWRLPRTCYNFGAWHNTWTCCAWATSKLPQTVTDGIHDKRTKGSGSTEVAFHNDLHAMGVRYKVREAARTFDKVCQVPQLCIMEWDPWYWWDIMLPGNFPTLANLVLGARNSAFRFHFEQWSFWRYRWWLRCVGYYCESAGGFLVAMDLHDILPPWIISEASPFWSPYYSISSTLPLCCNTPLWIATAFVLTPKDSDFYWYFGSWHTCRQSPSSNLKIFPLRIETYKFHMYSGFGCGFLDSCVVDGDFAFHLL